MIYPKRSPKINIINVTTTTVDLLASGSSTNSPKIANKNPNPVKNPVINNDMVVTLYPKKQTTNPININPKLQTIV